MNQTQAREFATVMAFLARLHEEAFFEIAKDGGASRKAVVKVAMEYLLALGEQP